MMYKRGALSVGCLFFLWSFTSTSASSALLLLEVGFIDNSIDNELFDRKFERIAEGIAKAILDGVDVKKASTCPSCGQVVK